MKNIGIFLGDVHGNGGISRVTWIIGNKINSFCNLFILSNYHNKSVRYKYSEDVKIEYLFEDRKPVHTRFLRTTKGIYDFIKRNKIEVLICAGAIFYPPCVLALKGTSVKLICWEHSNVSVEREHKFQGICRKMGAKNADLIVPLTKTDERLYREKYHVKNCKAIYNPVDDRLMGPVKYNANSKKIISVGRLCYQKNFELLVEVADIFLNNNPQWSWDIFGEGENRENIQKKINAAGLSDRLILKGRVSDLYERYNQYAMLVMTSRFEGFPMTLLESTAKGIPAISFDVLTGPNEIIIDGETGYLVQPEDIKTMAKKMQILAENSELRNKMSKKCMEIRYNFSCKSVIQQWEDILTKL